MESVAADSFTRFFPVGELSENDRVLHRQLQNMDPETVSNDPLLRRLLLNRNLLVNRDLETALNNPFARRLLQSRDPETVSAISNRPLNQQTYPATALPHPAQPPSNMPFNYTSSETETYYYQPQDMPPPPVPYHDPVGDVDQAARVDQSSDYENPRPVRHRGWVQHLNLMARFNQFEHLIEVQQQIGNVNVGLSEETISNNLKTSLIGAACEVEEEAADELCAICQDEYKVNETIGILECGHRYHIDCIKGWLILRNVCPICKATALVI